MNNTEESSPRIAYKGFDQNLRCRGFQYEVGQEYVHAGEIRMCGAGFHACSMPLDVFGYHPPSSARYALVEQDGEVIEGDDKNVSSVLRVRAEVGIADLIKAHVDLVWRKVTKTSRTHVEGNREAATATGYSSASSATGYSSASLTTGSFSTSRTVRTDACDSKEAVAIGVGYQNQASAPAGSWIVLAERNDGMEIVCIKAAKAGQDVKADTLYRLVDGEFVEAPE